MAISTYGTYLMHSTNGTTYTKLVDIKEFPDLGGSPETIETTTLSDKMQTFIEGIQSSDALEFPFNYTKADYQTLKALEGSESWYAVWFGQSNGTPNGNDGEFSFKGYLSVSVSGGGTNEAVTGTITITPSTVITFNATGST